MKANPIAAFCLVLLAAATAGVAQPKSSGAATSATPAATRYFQLTLNLTFGPVADQQPTTQTITTEVAVRSERPGSCKVRMISQVPAGTGSRTRYLELGTKFDCNDVHIEGVGLALQFTLETTRIIGMVKTRTNAGVVIDEPMLDERTVQLTVKLPLDQTKVVFDSRSKLTPPLKSLPPSVTSGTVLSPPVPPREDPPMLIEMTASESK
jgi:hypothetical protein